MASASRHERTKRRVKTYAIMHRSWQGSGLLQSVTLRHFPRRSSQLHKQQQGPTTTKEFVMNAQLNPIAFRTFAVIVAIAVVAAVASPILSLAAGAMA